MPQLDLYEVQVFYSPIFPAKRALYRINDLVC
jgi:hypothetical protein